MRNSYYHAFTVNVLENRWFYFGIAAAIVMLIVGWRSYYLTPRLKRIRPRFGGGFVAFLASIGAVGFCVFLVLDSYAGIIQFFDNHLAYNDDPAWSLGLAVFAVLCVGVIAWVLLLVMASIGSSLKHKMLKKKVEKIREAKRLEAEALEAKSAEEAKFREIEQAVELKTTMFKIG